MKTLAALAVFFLIQDAEPYKFTTPEGWKKERIPFPLPFAKDLDHQGFEDLRFAPGMFKADAEDYFSYAFVFWLEGKVAVDAASLEKDLLKYYKGLCDAVGKGKFDLSKITVKVEKQKAGTLSGAEAEVFHGRIDWFDPFVTGKPLTLHLEIWSRAADGQKHTCLFACVSPKEKSAAIWTTLRKIQGDFSIAK
jgi:hypothetical protein